MGPTEKEPFNIYVRFLSMPMDVRRVRVCDDMPLEAVEELIRESFARTYSDLPPEMLLYTKVRIVRGKKRSVLVEGVRSFLTPDCEVFVYPLNPQEEDDHMPLYVEPADERRYLG